MRIACRTILGASLLFSTAVWSQNVKIVIPAGTPADKELTSIAAETDAQKRISLYQDFVTKYADDKPAAAYADWQLSQQYLSTGDTGESPGVWRQGARTISQRSGHPRLADLRGAGDERQRKGCRLRSAGRRDLSIPSRSSPNPPMSPTTIGRRMWLRSSNPLNQATIFVRVRPTTPSLSSRIPASA